MNKYIVISFVMASIAALASPPCATAADVAEIILDNDASSGVAKDAGWTTSTSSTVRYGANYLVNTGNKNDPIAVTYTPTLPSPGRYEVQMRWIHGGSQSDRIPVDIHHSGSTTTVYISQAANGGKWNELGHYGFTGDGTEYVRIRSEGGGADVQKTIIADAVRFGKITQPLTLLDNTAADDTDDVSRVPGPGVAVTGAWTASKRAAGYQGANYWTDATRATPKSVTYTPKLPAPGHYAVQMRWVSNSNYAASVPVDIQHNGETTTVFVNQKTKGSVWNTLGTYEFFNLFRFITVYHG